MQVSTGRLTDWAHLERRRALLLALGFALLLGIGVSLLVIASFFDGVENVASKQLPPSDWI